ncbi:hypothetical protein [Allobaculum sp. Allo2]|nr:hypothetical protein [Allobaculum sp. Allo2]
MEQYEEKLHLLAYRKIINDYIADHPEARVLEEKLEAIGASD